MNPSGMKMIVGDIARFWSKTRVDAGCVIWIGGVDKDGYGNFSVAGRGRRAHRWIYSQAVGDPGPRLLHSCDRPPCVKLQHLSPGTQSQNIREAVERKRALIGSLNPSAKLTDAEVAEIRRMLEGRELHRAIAERFGVSKACIDLISCGLSWEHSPKSFSLGDRVKWQGQVGSWIVKIGTVIEIVPPAARPTSIDSADTRRQESYVVEVDLVSNVRSGHTRKLRTPRRYWPKPSRLEEAAARLELPEAEPDAEAG